MSALSKIIGSRVDDNGTLVVVVHQSCVQWRVFKKVHTTNRNEGRRNKTTEKETSINVPQWHSRSQSVWRACLWCYPENCLAHQFWSCPGRPRGALRLQERHGFCWRGWLFTISLDQLSMLRRPCLILTVRSRACASIGIIPKGVHVHAAFGVGVVACNVPWDGRRGVLAALLKGNSALDVRVSTQDGDYNSPLA